MLILFSVLRFLHIIAGILWAGGALTMSFFVAPTMGATGDAGKQFAGYLMAKTRFSTFMMVNAVITVLAGSILYGIDSNWFQSAWMHSPTGIGFGVGALTGIVAFVFGGMLGNINKALGMLGAQIQGKPTADQLTALQALMARQANASKWNTVFMLITIVLMASARLFG
ncbi:MAG: hypothetical protein J0L96_21345 [Anaerolineae bacterium]|nr:hypothetical protein [Anaerolineae bacterium]